MNGNTTRNSVEPSPFPSRSSLRSQDVTASLDFLDNLRAAFFEQIAKIESLARLAALDRASCLDDVENGLRERILALEAAQARLLAAAARRDLEWSEFLDDLEADRKRLADSWQRLESERTRSQSSSRVETIHRQTSANVEPVSKDRAVAVDTIDSSEVISREILRQFRSLQGDVRRNLK